jgi:hypothetical protein
MHGCHVLIRGCGQNTIFLIGKQRSEQTGAAWPAAAALVGASGHGGGPGDEQNKEEVDGDLFPYSRGAVWHTRVDRWAVADYSGSSSGGSVVRLGKEKEVVGEVRSSWRVTQELLYVAARGEGGGRRVAQVSSQ